MVRGTANLWLPALVFEIGPLCQRHLAYWIFAASNLFT